MCAHDGYLSPGLHAVLFVDPTRYLSAFDDDVTERRRASISGCIVRRRTGTIFPHFHVARYERKRERETPRIYRIVG